MNRNTMIGTLMGFAAGAFIPTPWWLLFDLTAIPLVLYVIYRYER